MLARPHGTFDLSFSLKPCLQHDEDRTRYPWRPRPPLGARGRRRHRPPRAQARLGQLLGRRAAARLNALPPTGQASRPGQALGRRNDAPRLERRAAMKLTRFQRQNAKKVDETPPQHELVPPNLGPAPVTGQLMASHPYHRFVEEKARLAEQGEMAQRHAIPYE